MQVLGQNNPIITGLIFEDSLENRLHQHKDFLPLELIPFYFSFI